jgi:hypothetical protein
MKTTDQPGQITLGWQVIQQNFLWFEVLDELHPLVTVSETDSDEVTYAISSNYDYEKLPGNIYRIYIDIGLKVIPFAAILTRTSFEYSNDTFGWDGFFTESDLQPLVKTAFETCLIIFREQCEAKNVDFDWELPGIDAKAKTITGQFIEIYRKQRRDYDIENKKMMEKIGLTLTPGLNTRICTSMTFMIIDEVLYYNRQFNRLQNRINFGEVIPEPLYFTLKLKCIEIKSKDVQLSVFHTLFFLICLDCALQLFLGDHETELISWLGERGLNEETRKIFISEGAKWFNILKEEFEKINLNISDAELKKDWNRLIQ